MSEALATQIFAHPEALPLRSVESILAAKVLVVAPHPDDECLGCGGAIALLNSCSELRIVVVSNGTMSHPNSRQFPASALQALRESETRAAMSRLGVEPAAIRFLGLPDGAVPTEGAAFDAALAQCCDYLAETEPQLIFLPWRADPHPDHQASWRLMDTALKQLRTAPRRLEYPIWDWDEAQRGNIESQIVAWRLDIHQVVQQKRDAIQLYRSQVSDLINDDPDGFFLSSEMIGHFSQPWEIYFEEIA
ncbi:MAG: PIG-L family deacetylase [Pegethrix bostrychoides GSE-TBD4-15B]|jgi:LmbE family N-acetylglucosaminyl deacetylase|uniref:PIG-L family deacetylase n=1 Tax=Pegethrix bostrychoides GSE-TBD4-15B TaxID=2839662 RepID=A0A951U6H0_9CYAN|nr:PIG-L family deacetylase [Pegethrix bostrychoides GSE-TBD4-15B]